MKTNRFELLLFVLRAYWSLIYFDLLLLRGNFAAVHEKIRALPVRERPPRADAVPEICHAVDIACIAYWKRVLCLQRSAATACLLKKSGVAATLVLGAQLMPFRAHAWVEVDGRIVNDKPYIADIYPVLDRC